MESAAPSLKSSNKDELLKIFRDIIPHQDSGENWRLLEIGSGSGHHAVSICTHLHNLQWVASDLSVRQNAITKTLREAKLPNVHGPIEFEVGRDDFPNQKFNAAFASQLLHAISWKQSKSLIKILGNRLRKGSQVMYYGPLKYDGQFSSPRFEEMDKTLKEKDAQLGIRSFEDVSRAMTKAGFMLVKDITMSDQNHFLYFERLEHGEAE